VKEVLTLDGVHKSFPSPDGQGEIGVLRGVDLSLRAGETLAITGPSGSGKSTLLSLMGGLDVPTRGSVAVDGTDLARLTENERARVRALRVGLVFQLHRLLPQCSVWENVMVPVLAARGGNGRDAAARARRLLDRVGLGSRLAHRPAELSGGECLRAAVARALVNAPAILLADEPTGSLDEETAGQLAGLLVEVNGEEGTALVVVTHSPALASLMGRRCRLHRGVLEE
jgi:lipoprotein-releasing system ATP-binding protein